MTNKRNAVLDLVHDFIDRFPLNPIAIQWRELDVDGMAPQQGLADTVVLFEARLKLSPEERHSLRVIKPLLGIRIDRR